ncbi:MAG: tetratricopeptide repeat protein, partial [Saprospiraceae bacterium]|nr:tetratricopeptide repeat protein [Saprospiraceae bacterium]
TSTALRKARIQAMLESAQPDKARQELEAGRDAGQLDSNWVQQKAREVQDSTRTLKARRDQMERKAATTNNPTDQLVAAKANLGLGETSGALKYATQVLRNNPRNTEAVQIAVDAQIQQGDTAKAIKIINQATRSGASLKSVQLPVIQKAPLPDGRKQ